MFVFTALQTDLSGDFRFSNLGSKESLNSSTLTLEIYSMMKKIVFEIVLILG